ncbi:MAG: inositol monophosphatase [bacterium]|nr:inositol monophosphatase [bacterium]
MTDEILKIAVEAAQKAGEVLLPYFQATGLERKVKDDKSFVTKADLEAEAIILKTIKAKFPDHAILAEESGEAKTASPYQWIIDPLDGTANFLNGIPIFGVSIGVYKNGEPEAAAVCHPATGELFSAARGRGAFFKGKKVTVSKQEASQGLVTFGMSKDMADRESFTKAFVGLEKTFNKRRHLGATALEMAYIARGGIEATVSFGSKLWDHAAGAVLILEAGGKITDFSGKPWKLGETHFIASNGVSHAALLEVVAILS